MNEREIATQIYRIMCETLTRRGALDYRLPIKTWAGPTFNGVPGYTFIVDHRSVMGRLERLHDPDLLQHLSTDLKGLTIGFENSQGFAYWVLLKKVDKVSPINLLKLSDHFECALILGVRNAGKTTLCRHIIKRRKEQGHKIIVYDPKPLETPEITYQSPYHKWPGADKVIGMDGDYKGIEQHMSNLVEQASRRAFIKAGERLLVFVDEYPRLIQHEPAIRDHFISLYINARESGVDTFAMSQSQRVELLGLQGRSDLLAGMVKVVIAYNQVTGERSAEADWGEGLKQVALPGEFVMLKSVASEPKRTQVTTPSVSLSREDKWLLEIIRRNRGNAPVLGIYNIIKKAAPRDMWEAGGPWTMHQLTQKFQQWETLGLLTAETRNSNGHKVARQLVT